MLADIRQRYPTSPPQATATMVSEDNSLSYSESEEEASEPAMLWASILRNGTLLVKATAENKGPDVVGLARNLLRRKVTTGWDTIHDSSSSATGPFAALRGGFRGLKFHVLEDDSERSGSLVVWTFACVYDSRLIRKEIAQAFVEQKLVVMTEVFRQMDDSWKFGGHLACQEIFGPVLRQRLDEMSFRWDHASVDDGLELSQAIIANNEDVLRRRHERIKKIRKKADKIEKKASIDKQTF